MIIQMPIRSNKSLNMQAQGKCSKKGCKKYIRPNNAVDKGILILP